MQLKLRRPIKSKCSTHDCGFDYFQFFFLINRDLVRSMLEEKEELRQQELQFKEQCRQELASLQKELQ